MIDLETMAWKRSTVRTRSGPPNFLITSRFISALDLEFRICSGSDVHVTGALDRPSIFRHQYNACLILARHYNYGVAWDVEVTDEFKA